MDSMQKVSIFLRYLENRMFQTQVKKLELYIFNNLRRWTVLLCLLGHYVPDYFGLILLLSPFITLNFQGSKSVSSKYPAFFWFWFVFNIKYTVYGRVQSIPDNLQEPQTRTTLHLNLSFLTVYCIKMLLFHFLLYITVSFFRPSAL